jgi:osmotically-inducible protein OsmY
MKKDIAKIICGFVIALVVAFSVAAQTATAPATKPQAKPKPAPKAVPKTDAEIEQCIKDRLEKAPKLKDQGFSVSVSGGVATFTGTAKNSGSKGGVSSIAKACHATKVVNNITVPASTKPKTSKTPTSKPPTGN